MILEMPLVEIGVPLTGELPNQFFLVQIGERMGGVLEEIVELRIASYRIVLRAHHVDIVETGRMIAGGPKQFDVREQLGESAMAHFDTGFDETDVPDVLYRIAKIVNLLDFSVDENKEIMILLGQNPDDSSQESGLAMRQNKKSMVLHKSDVIGLGTD